ncbi:MAG: iron-sulfur cluster assembly scaffold protein [Patescibacteria group bacterium]
MSLNYTKKTIQHFLHPQNLGNIKDADARADVGNMVCGDQLSFSVKVKDGVIKDIKFLSFGCASNIATASVLTEKVKGMKIEKAKNFDWQKIVKDLGGLPNQKVHCSILAVEGLKKVLAEYESSHPLVKKTKTIKKSK